MKTTKMIERLMENHNEKFKTIIDGEEIIAFYNANDGISIGRKNLHLSGKLLNAEWEVLNERYSFMEAINSCKNIKHEESKTFKPIQEALYDLLDLKSKDVIEKINGYWNIES